MNNEMCVMVRRLCEMTGVGTHECRKAIDYCRTHPDCTPMGYLKAKAFAVATPKLTFHERVKLFSDDMEAKEAWTQALK